jgi:hypothetical protein
VAQGSEYVGGVVNLLVGSAWCPHCAEKGRWNTPTDSVVAVNVGTLLKSTVNTNWHRGCWRK